jgi:L-amino acid N-acyltransferase YncA
VAKNIQIRNVPDEVHAVYKRRAAAAGMSLQEYLLADLTEQAGRLTMAESMARIASHARGSGVSTADIVQAIREDRESH